MCVRSIRSVIGVPVVTVFIPGLSKIAATFAGATFFDGVFAEDWKHGRKRKIHERFVAVILGVTQLRRFIGSDKTRNVLGQ